VSTMSDESLIYSHMTRRDRNFGRTPYANESLGTIQNEYARCVHSDGGT
jgi:hypothetical protein